METRALQSTSTRRRLLREIEQLNALLGLESR
jgi:hypothetical protein